MHLAWRSRGSLMGMAAATPGCCPDTPPIMSVRPHIVHGGARHGLETRSGLTFADALDRASVVKAAARVDVSALLWCSQPHKRASATPFR